MERHDPKDGALLSNLRFFKKRGYRSCLLRQTSFIGLSFLFYFHSSIIFASPIPVVRVMVEREKQGIEIEGFDLVLEEALAVPKGTHLKSTTFLASRLILQKKSKIKLECSLGGKIKGSALNKNYRFNDALHVSSMGGFIRVGKNQYRDDLYVYSFNGDCIVVNHVDLEKYVAGLLDSEMSGTWNLQTLMAQAVAARTYALYQMQEASSPRFKSLKPPFDLDSSVKDQVYEGAQRERYKAMQAVRGTRGMILSYEGKPIKAFYHSTCGGQTETPDRVWGMRLPYFQSVNCGFCNASPRFNWVFTASLAEVENKLKSAKLISGVLKSFQVLDRNNLDRANRVQLKTSLGDVIVKATKIRDALGSVNVKSTDFWVKEEGFNIFGRAGKLHFIGHGSGHAVGMCQWGAKVMGDRGRDFREILSHYYPRVELTRIY